METRRERPDGTPEVDMNDCLNQSLRMRPAQNASLWVKSVLVNVQHYLLQMNTGHAVSGSLHANTAMETITRMINPPMNVPPIMLTGLDLIIIQARLYVNGKTARKITEVAEPQKEIKL